MAALPAVALTDMESWSEVQVRSRLQDMLPSLLDSLDTDSTELRLRCLRLLLVTCLPHVDSACADRLLLSKALCAAARSFDEVLSVHDSLKDDDGDLVTSLLQVAVELVTCVAAVADCVLRAQLPGAFPSAATEALRVIQRAVTLCSRDGERSAQLLRKTSVTLQSLLAALGDDPVPVDDETSLVAHAQLCAQLAAQLEGLDMAAMAHAWKSFARLAQRHAMRLRGRLDVTTPIAQLAQGVCATLASLRTLREPDKKAGNAVKVAGFSLKLVIRLCEEFRGALGACHGALVALLAALATPRRAGALDADVQRHLDVGIAPLLAATLHDEQLQQCFAQARAGDDPAAREGVLHLSALLCLACARDGTLRPQWQDAALDAALSLVDQLPSPSRQSYELLVTHLGALTTTSTPVDFGRIESVLLAACATPRPLAAALAADVLVFAARVARPNVAVAQVARLAAILPVMPQSNGRCSLSALAKRLFRTLPDSERYRLLKRFPVDRHLPLWEALGVSLLPDRLLPGVVQTLTLLGGVPAKGDAAERALKDVRAGVEALEAGTLTAEMRKEAAELGRRLLAMAGSRNEHS